MSRTNIDIDDVACNLVMKRYDLATKREAVNFALHILATEPLDVDAAPRLRIGLGRGPPRTSCDTGPMILIDTSAWIEFLRDTGGSVCVRVDELLTGEIAVCDPVRMEGLAGARSDEHLRDLRGLLARASTIATEATDYEDAAALYRTCRRSGDSVGKLIDCLIAAAAIKAGIPVLHADTDFDVLARHTQLRVEGPHTGPH